MTKRYFYTDALAAAWMAKHHGMDIRLDKPDGQVFLETTLIHGLREWRDAIAACADYKFYIHPDSLPLLEPQEGDWGRGPYAGEVVGVSQSLVTIHVPERHNGKNYFCQPRSQLKVLSRNGIVFMWPESEEV